MESTAAGAREYPFYWRLKARLPERHGQACRLLARGKRNTIAIEFEDGYRVTCSGWSIRKRTRG